MLLAFDKAKRLIAAAVGNVRREIFMETPASAGGRVENKNLHKDPPSGRNLSDCFDRNLNTKMFREGAGRAARGGRAGRVTTDCQSY